MEARRDGARSDPTPSPTLEMPVEEQAAMLHAFASVSPDGLVATDRDGTVVWSNPAAAAMVGLAPGDLPGRPLTALVPDGHRDRVRDLHRRLLAGEHLGPLVSLALERDGDVVEVAATAGARRDADGRVLGTTWVLREEAEQALRDSEARYRAIAETAQEGILAVSPEGDTLFANERLAEILGLSMEEIYALGGGGIFPSADVGQAARRLAGRRPETRPERIDVPYHHPDGGGRVLLVATSPLTAADGSVLGSVAMVSDVTEQRAAEEALRKQALHDALTGLPNRLLFVDRLTLAAARQKRAEQGAVAVLFLDIDYFKRVNDTHGHEGGDRVLVEVASRLEQAVRATDTVARIGGDEFAVICEGAEATTAAVVASRIQQSLKEPVALSNGELEVSMSIGVGLSPPHRAEDLLRLADMAMYQAKATARGRVVMYDEGLPDDATRRLGVLRALREALDAGSLPLSYEPVVDLRTAAVVGVRAAPRWNHPTLGAVDEEEVLRAAEAGDLRNDLAAAVLRTAVHRLGVLRDQRLVEPRTFLRVHLATRPEARLPAVAGEVLSETRVPAELLFVELGAPSVRDHPEGAAELATGLRDLGAGLVLTRLDGDADRSDDLARFLDRVVAVAGLELDADVVAHVSELPDAVASAERVVHLARRTGVTAGVGGVTTPAQADLLRERGCVEARGPLWKLAVTTEEYGERGGDT